PLGFFIEVLKRLSAAPPSSGARRWHPRHIRQRRCVAGKSAIHRDGMTGHKSRGIRSKKGSDFGYVLRCTQVGSEVMLFEQVNNPVGKCGGCCWSHNQTENHDIAANILFSVLRSHVAAKRNKRAFGGAVSR